MKKLFTVKGLTWVAAVWVGAVAIVMAQGPGTAQRAAAPQAAQTAQAGAVTRTAAPARAAAQAAAPAQAAVDPAQYKAMVDRYCLGCHNARSNTPAANPLKLDQMNIADPAEHAKEWERVVRKLAVGAMPPQGMPRPDAAAMNQFQGYLITTLDRAAVRANHPGNFVAHRLNRLEYTNAIRDILNVEINPDELLPSDGGDFGFDNIATALKTSPLLLERYLTAALRISAVAVGDKTVVPGTATYPISLEVSQNQKMDGLPIGTRGGMLVKHNFPADGEYELFGRLNRTILNGYTGVEGWEEPHEFIILLDGKEVYTAPLGGPEDHRQNGDDPNKAGVIIDGRLTGRVFVTAGLHEVGFTWRDKATKGEQNVWMPSRRESQEVHMTGGLPRLKTVNIEGPYNVTGISATPSRDRIFVCKPTTAAAEAPCAQRILSNIARRAFRRPVTAQDTEAPLAFYNDARKSGGDFEAGVRAGLARILSSPSFIYRVERDPATLRAGAAHRVSDVELASRLSFFLWQTVPDDQLLNIAAAGRLRAPGVLEQQVRRMIADPRSTRMMNSFAGQWLSLRALENRVTPDLLLFPHFDDNIRKGFRSETELFFQSVVRDDRPVIELLTADYTFVNERLAKHYDIKGVYGERFRRVTVNNPNRKGLGLLAHGSFLGTTSVATRTSPVLRGKAVMVTLMGLEPPVPPPVVPALDESSPLSKEAPKTTRQRVESHRANPVCAACHRNIDPLGFSLENFDSTGQWREMDGPNPVDTKGVLQDGTAVNGPQSLRDWFVKNPEVFVTNVTERMLIYALGRGLEPVDQAVVRGVVRDAKATDYKFMSIIMGIVDSDPFQMRVKPEGAPGTLQASAR